jgi:hypothetical protein
MFPSMHGGPYPHNQGSASGYNAGPSNTRSFVSPANLSSSYGSQPYPYFRGGPPPPPPLPQSQNHPSPTEPSRTRGRSHSQAGPSTSNATAEADDDADDYEDKRTRNTAASGAHQYFGTERYIIKYSLSPSSFSDKEKAKNTCSRKNCLRSHWSGRGPGARGGRLETRERLVKGRPTTTFDSTFRLNES